MKKKVELNWRGLFNLQELYKFQNDESEKTLEKKGVYLIGYNSDEQNKFFPQYVGKSEGKYGVYSRLASHLMNLQAGYFLTYFKEEKDYFNNHRPEDRLEKAMYFPHRDNNKLYQKDKVLWEWNELKFLSEINFEPDKKIDFQKRLAFIWKHLRVGFAFYDKDDIEDLEKALIWEINESCPLQNQQIHKPKYEYDFGPIFNIIIP